MTDNLVISKKKDLEKFDFSEFHPATTIDALDDQISIVQFWRVLQKRRWLVLFSLAAVVLAGYRRFPASAQALRCLLPHPARS